MEKKEYLDKLAHLSLRRADLIEKCKELDRMGKMGISEVCFVFGRDSVYDDPINNCVVLEDEIKEDFFEKYMDMIKNKIKHIENLIYEITIREGATVGMQWMKPRDF